VVYNGSKDCSIRHHLITVQCRSMLYRFCPTRRYYVIVPQTQYNVIVKTNTSFEFSVLVTVQAVNHFYQHSPLSVAASFQFPISDHTTFRLPDVLSDGSGSGMIAEEEYETRQVELENAGNLDVKLDDAEYREVGLVDIETRKSELEDDKTGAFEAEDDVQPKYDDIALGKPEPEKEEDKSSSSALNYVLIAGIIVMGLVAGTLLGLLLYFLVCRKKPCKEQPPPVTPEGGWVVVTEKPPCPPRTKTKSCQTFDHSFYVVKFRRRTPTSCLRRDYEDRLRPNCHYAMKSEFERVPSGPTDIADDARSPQNAPLNRSQDVLPYDKNRVRLTRGRLADKTYINASLIRTVCHQPAVIVAQCPTDSTVGEFWKTVWDLNISSVVMLVPCDCRQYDGPVYWPRRTELPTVYSDVEVELVTETVRAHFALRRFCLRGWEGECVASRLVSHWQFLRWASGSGLPHHQVQFLDFLRDFQTKHSPDTGMLVHCDLGAGCSGIFLAIDALSTEGRRTGHLDVEECATLLCLERMNLIQTFRQYRYVYYCLIELFDTGHDTCIPVSCFHFAYTNLIQRGKQSGLSHLDNEFCVLSFPCFGLNPQRCNPKKPRCSRNDHNNNNDSQGSVDNDDSAWVLDGYLTSQLFVIPRRGILFASEFWKTLLQRNARTAVVLRPLEQSGLSIPCQGACSSVGEFLLECKKVRQNPTRSFLVYNLTIARQSVVSGEDVFSSQPVRLYEFVAWPDAVELPEVGAILDLVSSMAEWCRRDSQGRSTLFHVSHSPTDEPRAAVVCAIWTVLDRIHAENLIDIYMAARYMSSFIPSTFTSLVSTRIHCLLHIDSWQPGNI